MQSDTEVSPVTIPGPRRPTHDDLPPAAPARQRRIATADLVLVLLLVAVGVVVLSGSHAPVRSIAEATVPAAPIPPTPLELATKVLDKQAAALLRGDRGAWLAAVDPGQAALRKRYADRYRSLRALDVTHFEYHVAPGGSANGLIIANTEIAYCLSATAAGCPPYSNSADQGPPRFTETVTMRAAPGGYLIVGLSRGSQPGDLQPAPWQAGDLVFAQGERVTVAAPRALRSRLADVVRIADRAAVVTDRIAGYMGNRQPRYRIYLATDKAWKTWYGGGLPSYTVGYTIPLNDAGSDVLLHMSELNFPAELRVTIQHEMTHVATLSNLTYVDDGYTWLLEGVAEYAGWLPEHTKSDWTYPAVRSAVRGSHPPTSIVAAALDPNAKQRAVDVFYGLNHYAVDCMVAGYGERRAMDFIRRALRLNQQPDVAARGAFGVPFDKVDKGCVSWIREQVG